MNASSFRACRRFGLFAAAATTFAIASLANIAAAGTAQASASCPIAYLGQACNPSETIERVAAGDDGGAAPSDDVPPGAYGSSGGYGGTYGSGDDGSGDDSIGTCVLATATTADADGNTLSTTQSAVCIVLSTTYCDPQSAGAVCQLDTGATCRAIAVGGGESTSTSSAASASTTRDDAGTADFGDDDAAADSDGGAGTMAVTPAPGPAPAPHGTTVTTTYAYGLCNGAAPAGYVSPTDEYDNENDDDGCWGCNMTGPASLSESTNAVALLAGVTLVLSRRRSRRRDCASR